MPRRGESVGKNLVRGLTDWPRHRALCSMGLPLPHGRIEQSGRTSGSTSWRATLTAP